MTLSFSPKVLDRALFVMVSLAAGALFGDAFIHLIPSALEAMPEEGLVGGFVLLGILSFFALEKFFHWHHSHGPVSDVHGHAHGHAEGHHGVQPLGPMVLVADGVHNFADGMMIGASFLISTEVGISTAIAIALHEVPQEIGDYALLLHAGYSRRRALLLNFLSGLLAVFGTVVVFLLADAQGLVPAISAMAAGAFIYIAGSDLVPEMQKITDRRGSLLQLGALLAGIALMFGLIYFE